MMQFLWIVASIILAVALMITGTFGIVCAMAMMREERMLEDAKEERG